MDYLCTMHKSCISYYDFLHISLCSVGRAATSSRGIEYHPGQQISGKDYYGVVWCGVVWCVALLRISRVSVALVGYLKEMFSQVYDKICNKQ